MKKIVPSVGRKVWFYPSEDFFEMHSCEQISNQAFDATVVHVNGDTGGDSPDFSVNLSICDHSGGQYTALDTILLMPEDSAGIQAQKDCDNSYAIWVPYQAQQAK